MKITYRCILTVVTVIMLLCGTAQAAKVPRSSLADAEELLDIASLPPTDPDWTGTPRIHLQRAVDELQRIITEYGPNGSAFMDMAVAQAQLGNYQAAASYLEQARVLVKKEAISQDTMDNARTLLRVSDTAKQQLPGGQTILRVMGYPAPLRTDLWAVLSARRQTTSAPYPTYSNVLLTLFRGRPGELTRVWQSERLGYPGLTDGEFSDLQLYLIDLNRDGVPEAVIPETRIGADWMPSHVDVFAWRAGRLTSVLSANSEFPVAIRDLNSDRTYEVLTSTSVGWNIPRAAQPQWQNINAYRNGSYVQADAEFPWVYADTISQIQSALDAYPNDFQLHRYLGMAYQIRGQREQALAQYETALTTARTALSQQQDAQRRAQIQHALGDIQARISDLDG